jgi:hypothetical protein
MSIVALVVVLQLGIRLLIIPFAISAHLDCRRKQRKLEEQQIDFYESLRT